MREWLRMARSGALVGVLAGTVVGFAGCGSSGGGGPVPGTLQVTGTVSAPSAQVARAGGWDLRAVARAFALGSPVEAGPAVTRQRLRNAAVEVARLGEGAPRATVTTDAEGSFVIQVPGVQAGTACMITVKAQGAGGPIRLRAVVRAGDSTPVDVNEATTVGADAAEVVADEGADDETVVDTAEEVADQQETAEGQDPAAIPDLSDAEQARERIREHAHQHLVGNFGVKLQAGNGPQTPRRQAMQAVMAGQVYAHRVLGLPVEVRLSRAQVVALIQLMGTDKQFTAAEVAAALEVAGVKSGEAAATEADVSAALAALKARERLATPLAAVTDEQIPVLVALLVAEQAGDATVPFKVTTQEQLNAYVNALVGSEVAGPGPHAYGPGDHASGGPMMGAGA